MSRQGAISGPLGYISDVRQGGREVQAARTLYGLPWRPILGMLGSVLAEGEMAP